MTIRTETIYILTCNLCGSHIDHVPEPTPHGAIIGRYIGDEPGWLALPDPRIGMPSSGNYKHICPECVLQIKEQFMHARKEHGLHKSAMACCPVDGSECPDPYMGVCCVTKTTLPVGIDGEVA